MFQRRLDSEKKNGEQILDDQDAERDAAWERAQFALVVKDFDNDDRAA